MAMSATVRAFPAGSVKCPVGEMAFHARWGFVNVIEVAGHDRHVAWHEVVEECPDTVDEWLRRGAGTQRVQRVEVVPVSELGQIRLDASKVAATIIPFVRG